MSSPAVPNFDEWSKKQAPIPNFDEWSKGQQDQPASKPSALSQYGSTVLSDLNPMNAVRAVAHPIDTLKGMFAPESVMRPAVPEGQLPQDAYHRIQRAMGGGPNAPSMRVPDASLPEAAGHATAIALGSAIPGVVGKGMRATAEPLAESALGVKAINRAYGRTPGAAALDETTGVRPSTIGEQARTRLGDINTQLENVVGKSNTPTDISPARGVLARAETEARGGNAAKTVGQLKPMQKHLAEPLKGFSGSVTQPPAPMVPQASSVLGPNGQPVTTMVPGQAPPPTISPIQTPRALLDLKRGFGDEFIHNWNPETMKGVKGTAAQTYHTLADTLHKAVPESAELDTRASSLIPVAERAESIERGPGMGQKTLHRVAAHTGAGLGAGLGYYLGGLPGAVAGAVIPEVLSDPGMQMGAARVLNTGSKALKSAPARSAGQFIPLVNAAQRQEQQ